MMREDKVCTNLPGISIAKECDALKGLMPRTAPKRAFQRSRVYFNDDNGNDCVLELIHIVKKKYNITL